MALSGTLASITTEWDPSSRSWSDASTKKTTRKPGSTGPPRDAVRLMAKLVFLPIADQITSGTYLLYDGACGTGGMLTVGEETLQQLAAEKGRSVSTHLYGQEINAETYAICKADLPPEGRGRRG